MPVPSSVFIIDQMTGAVSANVSDAPPTGLYSLTVIAYNTTANLPDQTKDTGMVR